ncbi:serine-rich adhesin for platelets [Wyeomyia smithii]|uniref:serine-rich adhesin for platelets n=1 Tax=Wyeomyia smithii TaxID=174621 RepID=UPI002467B133|nr:serine-rich adhesin for platelets [Wyeomyia smithii]
MPCESCHIQFGIITRKKSCFECRRLFCRSCLEKRQEKILCHNCVIFTKRPLTKVDLGQLKVKDLIFYLQSKHISTSGCVEKEDLINLIIAHVNSGASSLRSPSGSADSGNGGVFNFSSASSTGGSSGGVRAEGGRRNQSGASRYGNFYPAGTDNCASTFDQLKSTCQNLFTSITEKLSTDTPKSNFAPGFSNTTPEGNAQPEGQSEANVFQQPRFGNNDVYQVNSRQSSTGNGSSTGLRSSTSGQGDASNERNSFPTDAGNSSGVTSGADSSSNTSSVSSPERPASKDIRLENVNLSLSARIESMLASDAGQNGCECSDEEDDDETRGTPKRKESRKATSGDTPTSEAGPSHITITDHTLVLEPKAETPSSSFGKINLDCERSSNEEKIIIVSTDTESWQIINNPESPTVTGSTGIEHNFAAHKSLQRIEEENVSDVPCTSHQISRRRSDSCLLAMNRTEAKPRCQTVPESDIGAHSSQNQSAVFTAINTNKCFKCGKRRSGIRKQLKKFRKQLETATACSETAKRQQLEAFLSYLERRSKGSAELSDSESITEEASISLAEVDPLEGDHSTGSAQREVGRASSSSTDENRLHSGYPRADGVELESTHVYSAGNHELANKSHIKLSDIKESADLDILSVKQLKEILMLNRVDFKGCCEKPELRERVLRLWRDYKSIPSIEKLPSDDLCKICMDAPIECVILECGHMTTCTACGKVLSECPICRQYIVRVVRFFRA